MPGSYHLDRHGHDDLVQRAIRVEHGEDPVAKHPVHHSHHTVRKLMEVPYEEKVRVPVKKKVATVGVETKVMKGVELVPVKKYKEVEETVIEVREEEVKGMREVWVKKQVPYTEIVKKPVKVTKVRKIPYTDYEQKEVEVTVDVPCHKVQVQTGYRDDTVLKTKMVEVEQDVTVEHRPAFHSQGPPRVRDLADEKHHGVVARGRSVLTSRPRSAAGGHRQYAYASEEYLVDGGDRTIRLSKPAHAMLGTHVDTSDGNSALIKQIGAGLIRDWNNMNPGREVRVGDRIVAVNGHRGDARDLMGMCSRKGPLELTIRSGGRGPSVRPHSARGLRGSY